MNNDTLSTSSTNLRVKKFKTFLNVCSQSNWNRLPNPSTDVDKYLHVFKMLHKFRVNLTTYYRDKDFLLDTLVTVLSLMNSVKEEVLWDFLDTFTFEYLVDRSKKANNFDYHSEFECESDGSLLMYDCLSSYISNTSDISSLDNVVKALILLPYHYIKDYDIVEDLFSMIIVPELKEDDIIEPPKPVVGSRYLLSDDKYYELIDIGGDFHTLALVLKTKLSNQNHRVVSENYIQSFIPISRGTDDWNKHFTLEGRLLKKYS